MAEKFYAVKNGKNGLSGVFSSWEECRALTEGVSGVKYKSFKSREKAEAFLNDDKLPDAKKPKVPEPEPYKENVAVAYVDGSYNKATKEFSCGAVLFWNNEKTEFSQKNSDPEFAEMRNVAGEIMGSVVVIRWCLAHKVPALEIYHDYSGVGKWGMGLWKTNKPETKAYADFCAKARRLMSLSFVKVEGHSGNYWNDEADRLAKKALGIF